MLKAGLLNHRVVVQEKTDTVNNYGAVTPSWSTAFSAWAQVSPMRGRERIEAGQVMPEMSHVVRVRFREGYTPDKRLLVKHKAGALNGAISSTTATSITIASAAALPASGQYWALIDSEIVRVTAGQGTTTLTVRRGERETTAATHSTAAAVTQIQILNIQDVANADSANDLVEIYCAEAV